MAVINAYVDTATAQGNPTKPAYGGNGGDVVVMFGTFEKAASDNDGSVWRLFKNVPSNLIPIQIDFMCDAIAGFTSADLGVYRTDLGAVVSKNCLMSAQTCASALSRATGQGLGLAAVDIDSLKKQLWEIAGQTAANKLEAYDIAVTGNTVGGNVGTVSVIAHFAKSN